MTAMYNSSTLDMAVAFTHTTTTTEEYIMCISVYGSETEICVAIDM